MKLSVAIRNAQLDAIETVIGASPILRILTGDAPADCAAAQTGTKLAEITLPADWMAAAASGQKAKSGTWQDTAADATGFAGYYRIYDSAGVTCHMQGLCGQNWAASTPYSLGQQVVNDGGKVYKCTTAGTSAASGGPTGTGAGITDGTCVWQYIGLSNMVLDNTSLAAGQQFTVTTFALTAGNA